jgi:hypothetical protein
MTTTAHDPGPVPPPSTSEVELATRIRVIAAIHALAAWLTDNPDVPLPHSIDVRANAGPGWRSPDAERLDRLDRFAELHGAERYTIEEVYEYAKLHLGRPDTHGAELTYTMSTTRKDKH